MPISYSALYSFIEWGIRGLMLALVIRRPQRPVVTLAWLAFAMLIPWLGLIVYMLFGDHHLGGRRAKLYAKDFRLHNVAHRKGVRQAFVYRPEIDEHQVPVVRVAQKFVGMPILGGNQVELLPHAAGFIECLIADIDAAVSHVHMVYFIIEDDDIGCRVGDALARAVKRGVTCRVLADAAGSFFFFSDLGAKMIASGVNLQANLPVTKLRRIFSRMDLRNHRKLTVIDGKIAYTGSHNLIRGDYGHKRGGVWQDLTARIVGPSVNQLQAVFLDDWHFETEESLETEPLFPEPATPDRVPIQVVPSGPDQPNAVMRDIIIEALHSARKHIIITTPYFVPDEALATALRLAAARGVRVDLVMPHASDKVVADLAARAYFHQLLEAGVHIYLNRAGLLHAKTMSVDDSFAMVGSANFDIRSFFLNFELNLLLYEERATTQLRECQMQYITDSDEVLLDPWGKRSALLQMAQNSAMLLSPLL